ncbi:MAG: response regulator transcription factor [Clostridiales bacterium]|nr:response regulator transcription factor [Clostridiales bacterium]
MKKILVADDEELIMNLVCDFLRRDGYEPLSAGDGEEALEVFRNNQDIALVILDIMMPKIDGWEVCRTIRQTSNVPIIMLTARSQEFDELTGFEAGADDYVTKPCSPVVLMKRVAALLKRDNSPVSMSVYQIDDLKLDAEAHDVFLHGSSVMLTLKEYSILYKLISNPGRVFSREQLLDDIWDFDFDGDMRTVDSHVARLRTKLGDWGIKHIRTIYGTGYKIEAE